MEAAAGRGRLVGAFVRFREVGIIGFIVGLSALVSLRSPAFLTASNFNDIQIYLDQQQVPPWEDWD